LRISNDLTFFYNIKKILLLAIMLDIFLFILSLIAIRNSAGFILIDYQTILILLAYVIILYGLSILFISFIDYCIRIIFNVFSIKGKYSIYIKIFLAIALVTLIIKLFVIWRY